MNAIIVAAVIFGCMGSFLMWACQGIDDLQITMGESEHEHWLRSIIIRHTGHDVGQLAIRGGCWHALTCSGWVPVCDLLGQPKNPGAGRLPTGAA